MSSEETLCNTEQILKAILEFRAEMNSKFDEVNSKFERVDTRFEDMRLQMMSFDVRIDRIEALTDEVLNVAYNARADVKVLREEVRSWAKDVADLQLRTA